MDVDVHEPRQERLRANSDQPLTPLGSSCLILDMTNRTVLHIDTADMLPGHEHGRQALRNALRGDHCTDLTVEGHWDNDTFVVGRILDMTDGEGDRLSDVAGPISIAA